MKNERVNIRLNPSFNWLYFCPSFLFGVVFSLQNPPTPYDQFDIVQTSLPPLVVPSGNGTFKDHPTEMNDDRKVREEFRRRIPEGVRNKPKGVCDSQTLCSLWVLSHLSVSDRSFFYLLLYLLALDYTLFTVPFRTHLSLVV